MKKVQLGLSLGLALACGLVAGEDQANGKVSEVIDGNTLIIETRDNETYTVLLHGIDSPEPGQQHAEQSTELLKKLLLHKKVTLTIHGRDRKGNRLAKIEIDGAPDPRHELLRAGLAWPAERHNEPELEVLKEEARLKNVGLWQEENPTPPWTYRREQSSSEAKSS
jgi:endonuclease YncB( thermonuclease family)